MSALCLSAGTLQKYFLSFSREFKKKSNHKNLSEKGAAALSFILFSTAAAAVAAVFAFGKGQKKVKKKKHKRWKRKQLSLFCSHEVSESN